MRIAEFGMRNHNKLMFEVRGARCEVQTEFRLRNAECGITRDRRTTGLRDHSQSRKHQETGRQGDKATRRTGESENRGTGDKGTREHGNPGER